MDTLSPSTLIPISMVFTIIVFAFFLGGQARKLKDHGDRIEKLEKEMKTVGDLSTRLAVIEERIINIERGMAGLQADIKKLIESV